MPLPRRLRTSSRLSTADPRSTDAAWTHLDLYRIALDEYRFQVNLNWSRTQYFIALNLVLLGLATTLLAGTSERVAPLLGALALYLVGTLCAVLGLAAGKTQRTYYHRVRDRVGTLADILELGEHAVSTTPGQQGSERTWGKVHQAHTLIISAVLGLDLVGAAAATFALACH